VPLESRMIVPTHPVIEPTAGITGRRGTTILTDQWHPIGDCDSLYRPSKRIPDNGLRTVAPYHPKNRYGSSSKTGSSR
jgi:hypothetical protein